MGMLVDGVWQDVGYDTSKSGGSFVRSDSQFRDVIGRADAEPGRYHLYVSLACPWAHRTLVVRALKGLERHIGVSIVHWRMLEHGWTFEDGPGVVADPVMNADYLHQLYTRSVPDYSGRVTVPVLYDLQEDRIVSNESAEIVRMLGSAFDALPGVRPLALYPEAHRKAIDETNARVYDEVNNGVYKAGFATEQAPYEEAARTLFTALDDLEARLALERWLVGDVFTEADVRLFTTLVRFDAVYHGHFKCNLRRLADYPNLWAWTREIAQCDAVRGTIDLQHIQRHYYESQRTVNPTGIFPIGPVVDFEAPHDRARLAGRPLAG